MKQILIVLISAVLLCPCNISFADVYKYEDEEGVVHLTQTPSNPKVKYTLILKDNYPAKKKGRKERIVQKDDSIDSLYREACEKKPKVRLKSK